MPTRVNYHCTRRQTNSQRIMGTHGPWDAFTCAANMCGENCGENIGENVGENVRDKCVKTAWRNLHHFMLVNMHKNKRHFFHHTNVTFVEIKFPPHFSHTYWSTCERCSGHWFPDRIISVGWTHVAQPGDIFVVYDSGKSKCRICLTRFMRRLSCCTDNATHAKSRGYMYTYKYMRWTLNMCQ